MLQMEVFSQQSDLDSLIGRYEAIMDQIDDFNRKLWADIYPADVFGHGMLLIQNVWVFTTYQNGWLK